MGRLKELKENIFSQKKLDDKNVKGLLLNFSIPSIIAIIVNGMYGFVDSMFVGQYVGEIAIGAIAIIQPFIGIIVTFGTVISTGGMSVLSRSLGEENKEKAKLCFANSITLIMVVSIIGCFIASIFLDQILNLLGASGEIFNLGKEYMRIILIGLIFMAPSFILGQLLKAEGKAKESMMILLVGSVSNMVLDYIFIVVLKWGISGAALATSLAYFLSFVYAVMKLVHLSSIFEFKKKYFKIDKGILNEILSIGMSSFISQGSGNVAAIVANNVMMNVGGEQLITSIGIFAIIQNFVFMPITGITQSMQPILGFNYGKGRLDKVKEIVETTLKSVFNVTLLNTIIVLIFTRQIASFFVKENSDILSYAIPNIRLGILFACIGAQQWVGGTVFRSLGMAKNAYFFSVLRMILIFMPAVLILGNTIGPLGCWIAYALADLLSGMISRVYMLREIAKLKSVNEVII